LSIGIYRRQEGDCRLPSGPVRFAFMRNVIPQGSISPDPTVSSLDELDAQASIFLVGVAIPWYRWNIEVIERHEESYRGAVFGDEVK
jgi:hypothetical protein